MITITVDPRALIKVTEGLERQLPFATMKALNECANIFQRDERQVMQSQFTIRRAWVLQGVKIDRGDFATKQNLSVRVHIDEKQSFLDKFEEGGIRTPRTGKALSIPIDVRSNRKAVVPLKLRPKNLGLAGANRGRGGTTIVEGANGVFLIQRADGSGVILQRLARKIGVKRRQHMALQKGQRHDYAVKVLYALKPRTPVPASLHFDETANSSFAKNWPIAFEKWWNEAVRTATP